MTKIVFKYDLIKKNIIPISQKIIDELNNLKFKIESLNIPSDFKYIQYIKSLYNKIESYKELYSHLIDNIDIINKNLEVEFDNLSIYLDNIKDIKE